MKLTCTQSNLAQGLNITARLVEKNPNLPILNNVLLKAQKDGLLLTTTNLEIGIRTKIRGKIQQEGEYTIPARLLLDFVNTLRDENIDLILQEDGTLNIKGENHQTAVRGSDAADFPVIPDIERKHALEINAHTFSQALAQIVFSMSADESRPELNGALFQITNSTCTIAATDSYRLSETTIPIKNTKEGSVNLIIPAKTIHELLRILGLEGAEKVTIYTSENQIQFTVGATELISRIIMGDYPDYKQIIPKQFKNEIEFQVSEMIQAIKTTALFCKQGINDVRIALDKRFTTIAVQAENTLFGKNTSNVTSLTPHQETDIVFNYKFLLDGLQHIATDTAILKTNDATSPAVLTPKKKSGFTYIIMPIRQ